MKPAVVTEMIKSGENPLDKSIGELNDMAEDMSQQQDGTSSEEQFAKFLWKMDRTGGLTEEQRESYIGVYRLIYQVEQGDGAAIGALIAQGTEVTLRNLMTAVRSGKHTGRDYTIDDTFGALEDFSKDSLSITEQIEMAYQKDCLTEAGEEMTPVKMAQFENEDQYLDMSPEQFRDSLTDMEQQPEVTQQEAELQQEYIRETGDRVRTALAAEEQVYEVLEQYDIPTTPAFLEGMQQWLENPNQMYRKLNQYADKGNSKDPEEITISDLIEDLIEDFGEAMKTPEEMAEAQRKLEETAENVMKNMLVEQDVTTIDVRGMKLITTQIKALGQMAEHSETYEIPILVEDQIGNLSLKIVRGQDQKGLVDVALDTEKTGAVHSSFRYEAGQVVGDLSFEQQNVRNLFADHAGLLAETMSEAVGLPVSFSFGWNQKTDAGNLLRTDLEGGASGFQNGFVETEERDEVSTKVLYGVARSFIDTLTEIIS
jgi:hypothetical protein